MTYKDLRSFQQAEIIYDFTVEFCRRYIDKSDESDTTHRSYASDRMTGQMVQAARSGKQNIAEGCAVSKTAPKNELFLLGVARGSLKELLEDYEDFLRQKGLAVWGKDDPRAAAMRRLAYGDRTDRSDTSYRSYRTTDRLDPGSTQRGGDYGAGRSDRSDMSDTSYKADRTDRSDTSYRPDRTDKTYTTYRTYLDDPERAANAMITMINQTTYLLDQQMNAVRQQMEEKGISHESHEQRLRRIMNEEKKRNQEFDAYLQGIVEKGKEDKQDRSG